MGSAGCDAHAGPIAYGTTTNVSVSQLPHQLLETSRPRNPPTCPPACPPEARNLPRWPVLRPCPGTRRCLRVCLQFSAPQLGRPWALPGLHARPHPSHDHLGTCNFPRLSNLLCGAWSGRGLRKKFPLSRTSGVNRQLPTIEPPPGQRALISEDGAFSTMAGSARLAETARPEASSSGWSDPWSRQRRTGPSLVHPNIPIMNWFCGTSFCHRSMCPEVHEYGFSLTLSRQLKSASFLSN